MDLTTARTASRRLLPAALAAAYALLLCACAAATRPAETGRPRADEPPYPVLLTASDERRTQALANWAVISGAEATTRAAAPTPELQPVTATLRALPEALQARPLLPKVTIEDAAEQSEEETRESLRRFIASAAPLLGAEPGHLSLVGIEDAPAPTGAKRATYRQSPFDLPLRNGFGLIEITFTPDLSVVSLSSTAIPDSARLRRSLQAVTRQLTAESAASSLAGRAVTFTGPGGAQQTRTVTQADSVAARELVVFPVPSASNSSALELHLAWELAVGEQQGSPLLVYVDAVTGEQLGATRQAATPAQ